MAHGGEIFDELNKHLNISDVEVLVVIRKAYENQQSSQHGLARRIQCREHFRLFYETAPSDTQGGKLIPGKVIAQAAEAQFGLDHIRYDHIPPKTAAPIFPVLDVR